VPAVHAGEPNARFGEARRAVAGARLRGRRVRAEGVRLKQAHAAWYHAAPWLDCPRSRQFALTPAPTAPQFVHTIRDPNETARAFGPATSADAVHCAALVSMLNSLRSFVCRDETLG
jgi:hypothetical protein